MSSLFIAIQLSIDINGLQLAYFPKFFQEQLQFINQIALRLYFGLVDGGSYRMALFEKKQNNQKNKEKQEFVIDRSDETFIQNLSEQIVEDAAYSLGIGNEDYHGDIKLHRENPYFSKEARDALKFEMNIALRKLEREKNIHLSHGTEKGNQAHPLAAFIKAHMFEVVRNEIISPSN